MNERGEKFPFQFGTDGIDSIVFRMEISTEDFRLWFGVAYPFKVNAGNSVKN